MSWSDSAIEAADSFVIDCRGVQYEADFWRRHLDVVNPDGGDVFGRNLDAFRDAVCGGGPGWPGECSLHFLNAKKVATFREGRYRSFLEDIAREATSVRITFDW